MINFKQSKFIGSVYDGVIKNKEDIQYLKDLWQEDNTVSFFNGGIKLSFKDIDTLKIGTKISKVFKN